MTEHEERLTPETLALRRVQQRYDRSAKRTQELRAEVRMARQAWNAAFEEYLKVHPWPATTHAEAAQRWGVEESTVRLRRSLLSGQDLRVHSLRPTPPEGER